MDLKQMQAMGAFVPAVLVVKEIAVKRPVMKPAEDWTDPAWPEPTGESVDDTLKVWIRKRSSANFLELANASNEDRAHIMLLRCVFHEDGAPAFTDLDEVKRVDDWLFVPLFLAVNEVNQYAPKNSVPRTSYGTSSPSSSAAPSRKLRRASARKNAGAGSPTGRAAAP